MDNNVIGNTTGAFREKYWGELKDDEKTERTRLYVKRLEDKVSVLEQELHQLKTFFLYHAHLDGRLVQNEVSDLMRKNFSAHSRISLSNDPEKVVF